MAIKMRIDLEAADYTSLLEAITNATFGLIGHKELVVKISLNDEKMGVDFKDVAIKHRYLASVKKRVPDEN